jgi:uncharacterized sulfatase
VWPADDPTGGFGDTDGGLSKTFLWNHRAQYAELARLAFDKRLAEELYDIRTDPGNLRNLAGKPETAKVQRELAARLDDHRKRTADPRILGRGDELDAVMRRFPSLSAAVNRAQEGRKKK